MSFTNKMALGVSEGILLAEHESDLITDLHSDLKNSKWQIQYGSQVNLITFYKPGPPY